MREREREILIGRDRRKLKKTDKRENVIGLKRLKFKPFFELRIFWQQKRSKKKLRKKSGLSGRFKLEKCKVNHVKSRQVIFYGIKKSVEREGSEREIEYI